WVQELRSKLKPVTRAIIQIKAKTLSQKSPYITYCSGITESKFSNKWVDGFMTRYKLSNQRRTSIAQKLPEDLNMDETKLLFNLSNNTIIDNCSANIFLIRTCEHKKSCFTVVLTCLVDETKLPP
ncbi:15606_t:CDS:2, partial [Dentiscutata erythropus]